MDLVDELAETGVSTIRLIVCLTSSIGGIHVFLAKIKRRSGGATYTHFMV